MTLPLEVGQRARELIAGRLGLSFPAAREHDLERGLRRASEVAPVPALEAYLQRLAGLPDASAEWRRLAADLTVGETYFFRDHACFHALAREVLPALIAGRRSERGPWLRLWSAGCATGEEPYSLAILMDRLLPNQADWSVTILATDINQEALDTAARGCYRPWSFRDTPEWVKEGYFRPRGREAWEILPRVRRMVTFAPLNLAADVYPAPVTNTSAMDLILCRNVLMYFTEPVRQAVVRRLQGALGTGGWLAVSPAEATADLLHPLRPVDCSGTIFFQKGSAAEELPLPLARPGRHESAAGAPGERATGGAGVPARPAGRRPALPGDASHEVVHPSPESGLPRARTLADSGRLEEARRQCDTWLATHRLDQEAHLLRAAICQELGDVPAAQAALRRALYLAPDAAAAHFLQGSLHLRQGERRRARRAMEAAQGLLAPAARDEVVPGGGGLTAGRLLETVRAYLEML